MKFSIITVCYNAETEINQTIDSVLNQNYTDYEYWIIDGGSKDTTLDIIQKRGVRYISESDNGIYDAMNKGISISTGEYILFLNAGDYFVNSDVLKKVSEIINGDIAYGDVILSNTGLFKYREAESIDNILNHMPFCHQCVFTRRTLFNTKKYSLKYSVLSDYEFYLFFYLNNVVFQHMQLPISVYQSGGYSYENIAESEREKIAIQKKYALHQENYRKSLFKNFIRKVIPKTIYNKYMHRILIKNGYKSSIGEVINNG